MLKNINYIFVDLDGTVIKTDLFVESIIKLVKRNPLNVFLILLWLFQGRSVAKSKVASAIDDLDVASLPYEEELIEYLKNEKKTGKQIILATASHEIYAQQVAEQLGIFDSVIATSAENNLKGKNKLKAILEICNGQDFIYAGDSFADVPIWEAAAGGVYVNAPKSVVLAAESAGKAEKQIANKKGLIKPLLKQMRLHQWAKNTLVFVPLFTSHSYAQAEAFVQVIGAFLCFSICASGVYFLNDLFDLDSDRRHEKKRNRPLASCDLPLSIGVLGAIGLPLVSLSFAFFFLSWKFCLVLVAYFAITNLYSFWLKTKSTADVMTLAVLYTMRIAAGAAVINVEPSSWLLAFSIFVFVSLAYLKRYIEVSSISGKTKKAHGRGYYEDDSETMFVLGIANITASVLILALYINSQEVVNQYNNPKILWLMCFLMLYWGNRIWVGARRGKVSEDPVVFALKDNISRLVGLLFVLVVIAAKYI